MSYDKLVNKFILAELELSKERNDILEQLRDPKRELLLNLLENNVNSTRRMRALKEATLGRIAYNVLDQKDAELYEDDCDDWDDCDDCECDDCNDCECDECVEDECCDGECGCEDECDEDECEDEDGKTKTDDGLKEI